MIVLGIETSSPTGSLALLDGEKTLVETFLREGMSQGKDLVPEVSRLLGGAGLAVSGLGLVAVSLGPGSFTGLRIGVACAKTLAYLSSIPLVGVDTLEVLAENVPPSAGPAITPLVAAKKGFFYTARFKARTEGPAASAKTAKFSPEPKSEIRNPKSPPLRAWQRSGPDRMVTLAEFLEDFLPPLLVFGNGARAREEDLSPRGYSIGPEDWGTARAGVVARLGLGFFQEGLLLDPHAARPFYLALPAAEERRGA